MNAETSGAASAEVERVFREVYGQAVATLVRVFGDITIAEDAVQDAFVVATHRWRRDGIPPNPDAWIVTTARNRGIDQTRRSARGKELTQRAALTGEYESGASITPAKQDGPVTDDRLRLIFTCCHPALRKDHQVALTLRLLGGLSVVEVARAFLVTEAAMAKRLVRVKYKIKAANIPYTVPSDPDLPIRLHAVLSVLYLIYNTGADDPEEQAHLRHEATRLARALAAQLPDEPEAQGLLALMLLNESRVSARSRDGEMVLLRDQDRGAWNSDLIDEGHAIVRRCIRRASPGPFQLQAAIQSVHCHATTYEDTDWAQVVELYDHLYAMSPTAVVALNRAIAISEADGPDAGLTALDAIGASLDNYYPMHAARAATYRRLGRADDAKKEYERAVELATSKSHRDYLITQVTELSGRSPHLS